MLTHALKLPGDARQELAPAIVFGECEIFVADITPVSKVPRREGVKEKRNMNINVGIELGYVPSRC
jgi:hypothetical protein